MAGKPLIEREEVVGMERLGICPSDEPEARSDPAVPTRAPTVQCGRVTFSTRFGSSGT